MQCSQLSDCVRLLGLVCASLGPSVSQLSWSLSHQPTRTVLCSCSSAGKRHALQESAYCCSHTAGGGHTVDVVNGRYTIQCDAAPIDTTRCRSLSHWALIRSHMLSLSRLTISHTSPATPSPLTPPLCSTSQPTEAAVLVDLASTELQPHNILLRSLPLSCWLHRFVACSVCHRSSAPLL